MTAMIVLWAATIFIGIGASAITGMALLMRDYKVAVVFALMGVAGLWSTAELRSRVAEKADRQRHLASGVHSIGQLLPDATARPE